MLSYARVQADEIVAQARREGEALLERYRTQAEQEAQETRESARQEGYRQGYGDGMKKAQAGGAAAMENQRREEQQEVRAFLEKAAQAREDLLEKAQDELCDLSIAVAEKVIHISLRSSREVIARMIQVATERLKRREWVRIYVGGCEARESGPDHAGADQQRFGGPLRAYQDRFPLADDELGCLHHRDAGRDHRRQCVSTQLHNLRDVSSSGG